MMKPSRAGVGLAVGLLGCGGTVIIQQMQLPTFAPGACTASANPVGSRLDRGTFDVALRNRYTARPLFRNSSSSRVFVRGLVVRITEGSPDGPLVAPPFTVFQTVRVPPDDEAAGFIAAAFDVVPPQVGEALRAVVCRADSTGVSSACPVPRTASVDRQLLVGLTAFGETGSGGEFETLPFHFPVRVCCGCLISFPLESRAPESAHRSPNCNHGVPPTGPASCEPGQDLPLDCRFCSNTNPACQPVGYATDPRAPTCGP